MVFIRKLRFPSLIIALAWFIAGCQPGKNMDPIDAGSTGIWNEYMIYPLSLFIKYLAELFDGNYGLAIVLLTLIVRFAIMPLMFKQQKRQIETREKMIEIQPEIKELKEKYNETSSPENKQAMQKEMMEIYQKHAFNPVKSMGCLPMLIQLPILIGVYQAIMRTPEIAEHTFLWFDLGSSDPVLPVIAALVYVVQFRVTLIGSDPAQQKQMAVFGYITPLMMGMFSFVVPAALPLYWTVGGIFLLFQTALFKWIYREKNAELRQLAEQK